MDAPTGLVNERDGVADQVEEVVEEKPWIQSLTRMGWIAKGAVYTLMGLTAFTIGRQRPTYDDASPEGAVAQVMSNPGGRLLVAALAVGLILYSAWRLLSAAIVRGGEIKDWLDRIGYVFSAAFYTVLAFTAAMAVLQDHEPEDQNTVERISGWMLSSTIGRWALLVAGAVIIAVGLFFAIDKGLRRSFKQDLDFHGAPEAERDAVIVTGTAGWISRGVVTAAVGWFVLQSAWRADRGDARGFDSAFRELASTQVGSLAVCAAGLALIAYGVFCVLAVRHLELENVS